MIYEMESHIGKVNKNHSRFDNSIFCFKQHFERVASVHFQTLIIKNKGQILQ